MLDICLGVMACTMAAAQIGPAVEVEEDVYTYQPANNGAGPTWCYGSTCIVRLGDRVVISGLETLADAVPLHNVRWVLYERGPDGWQVVRRDDVGRTREPCPLAVFPDGRLLLSVNPTLTNEGERAGPAEPQILQFQMADLSAPPRTMKPVWQGQPAFTEHSYRSVACDGPGGEFALFNILGHEGYHWSLLDHGGAWSASGELVFPWGADYEQPESIRLCYPEIVLRGRAVHFLGISDIIEPVAAWREAKREITGQQWDYEFRRLFYTWTPDVTKQPFAPWVELASREKTCGWIQNQDEWLAPNGDLHLLWHEKSCDPRLREKFYAGEKLTYALRHAVVRDGKVLREETVLLGGEGESSETPGWARLQATPDGRLFVFCYVGGSTSENRLIELLPDGVGRSFTVPLERPFTGFMTATERAGCAPSEVLDVYGTRTGTKNTMSYARIRLP